MTRRVVITGMAVNCCLGKNKNEVRDNLESAKTGLKKFKSAPNVGLENLFVGEWSNKFDDIQNVSDLEEIEQLSIEISKDALNDSKLSSSYLNKNSDRVSLSYGSSLAGIDHIIKAQDNMMNQGNWLIYSRRFSYLLMKELNINGSCYVDSTACSSGTASVGVGYDLIKNNTADVVLAGGVDNLSVFSLFGFHSLNNLSKEICKPFDKTRDGINLGAGASFFVLEELTSAIKRNAKIYGEIVGYGLYNDAYHITSPNPNGYAAKKSMRKSVENIAPNLNSNIYINTHGTGTSHNDSMEFEAIKENFRSYTNVIFSSTKSRTGHCLGAAGSVELAISLIGLEENKQYKTLNSAMNLDSSINFKFDTSKLTDYVISNSFAFGGNAASIAVRNIKE